MKRSLRRPIIAYNRRKTTERMAIAVLRPSTCLLLIMAAISLGGCAGLVLANLSASRQRVGCRLPPAVLGPGIALCRGALALGCVTAQSGAGHEHLYRESTNADERTKHGETE